MKIFDFVFQQQYLLSSEPVRLTLNLEPDVVEIEVLPLGLAGRFEHAVPRGGSEYDTLGITTDYS